MKQTILAISGKPGLYKLVSRAKNSLIVEALDLEQGKKSSVDFRKATPKELHDYFTKVLPNWDQERVQNSHIKKLIQWYDILVEAGLTDFEEEMAPTEGDNIDDRKED